MALNPSYAQQAIRTLPFCVGYVKAIGTLVNTAVGPNGYTWKQYILAEGEWEGAQEAQIYSDDGYGMLPAYTDESGRSGGWAWGFHFHAGTYGTRGLPNCLASVGPDQGVDMAMGIFSSTVPALELSGIAYYLVGTPLNGYTIDPQISWRTLRCRMFDSTGEVTGYGFTTNPTWQMIEAVLRYKVKPQQAGIMGLTNAEKACFDWPAMVAHAARNSAVLTNGKPRFSGNYAFAATSKLTNILETMLRGCRSYKVERGTKLAFIGDDPRSSVFAVTQRHVVPGTLNISKKDLRNAANVYIPQYREVDIPAISQVTTAAVTWTAAPTSLYPAGGYWSGSFNTTSQQPFASLEYFVYSNGSNDAVFAGDWTVFDYGFFSGTTYIAEVPPNPTQFNAGAAMAVPPTAAATATGGYLGKRNARFQTYAPAVVQHRAHQRAAGQIAPGINPLPRQTPVYYDLGNTTFDQANRVMQYLMARDLGTDGAGWIAPRKGTLSLYLESVDAAGNALIEVEMGDRITLDETVSSEFQGDYEVLEADVQPPNGKDGLQVDLTLQSYNPDAFPDTSYPPGDSYQTLTGLALPTGDFPVSDRPFWVLQATPIGGIVSGSLAVSIADLSVLWSGNKTPTSYGKVTCTAVPLDTPVLLFLYFSSPTATPTLSLGTVGTGSYPPIAYPLAYGTVLVFYGTISAASGFSGPVGLVRSSGATAYAVSPAIDGAGSAAVVLTPGGSSSGSAPTVYPALRGGMTLVASPSTLVDAGSATFTCAVASSTGIVPTGTVQFYVDGTASGSPVAMSGGSATSAAIAFSGAGTYAVIAAYSGDANYAASSTGIAFTVTSSGGGGGGGGGGTGGGGGGTGGGGEGGFLGP